MSTPPNFRVNCVSSALTVLLFLSFAFTASAHRWCGHEGGYSKYASNMWEFNGRKLGEAVSTSEWLKRTDPSVARYELNVKGLYGIVYVGGCGTHGAKEATPWNDPRIITGHHYRWPIRAYTRAHAGVWFGSSAVLPAPKDKEIGEGKHTVDLEYEIKAVANHKQKKKKDADTVTMVRVLVWGELPGGGRGRGWRWKDTASKSLSKTVDARAHTYSDPLTSWIPRSAHLGWGWASVQGLPNGIAHTNGKTKGVDASYNSPSSTAP